MEELRRYIRTVLSERFSLDSMDDYKKWKRKNVTLRGVSKSTGEYNGAGASLGEGLYTASLSNKEMARKYGDVYYVVNGRPKNPLVFNNVNEAEIWLQQNLYFKNYKNLRDFHANTTIQNEVLKMGRDGIEVKGREMVNFKPENVKYLKTEAELIHYYENNVKLDENLIGEDYPAHFDMNVFKSLKTFKERIQYCESNLKKIGSGSSRVVYQIDNDKVLKLAKNKKGIAQNETEIDRGSGSYFSSILAQVFDSHPDGLWVEMEKAIPINKYEFRRLTEFKIEDVGAYLINFQDENSGKKAKFHLQQPLLDRLDNDEFVQQLREFVAGTDALVGDLGQASSYGIVRRNNHDELVLIDFGITEDIFKDYYTESVDKKESGSNINDNFWKWFAGSKIIDADGNPQMVHHGTAKKFSQFNFKNAGQKIIWFTSNKGAVESGEVGAAGRGHIMDLYVSMKNPAGWNEYQKYGLGQLEGLGYDGAILDNGDGTFDGFVFEPTQIKSVANKGEWNASNKSIYKEDNIQGNEKINPEIVYAQVVKLHKNGWEQTEFEDPNWIVKDHDYFILKDVDLNDPSIKWNKKPAIYSKSNTEYPPIVVSWDGWIIDGMHRSSSARERGDKTIKAYIGHKSDVNSLKEAERKLGKSLSDQIQTPYITIYRAAPMSANEFFDKDYVTLSKNFAIEHAENNHVYHEEPFHVIQTLVSTKDVYDAYNPGEYFYSGPNKKAREIYVSKGPEEYKGLDELADTKKSLKKILDSDEAYEILDASKASGTMWTQGGCAILASALNRAYGYPIYAIYDNDLKQVDHFVVKTPDGLYLDYRGKQKDIIKKYKEDEMLWDKDLVLVPYKKGMNVSDIVIDSKASQKLAELIVNGGKLVD